MKRGLVGSLFCVLKVKIMGQWLIQKEIEGKHGGREGGRQALWSTSLALKRFGGLLLRVKIKNPN